MEITRERVVIVCGDTNVRGLISKVLQQIDDVEFQFVEVAPEGYLTAKDELDAEAALDLKMTHLYELNKFLVGQWQFLSQMQSQLMAKLQQPKFVMDIRIQSEIKKITNDLEIIAPESQKVNAIIFKHIEERYAQGKKFQYCKTEI